MARPRRRRRREEIEDSEDERREQPVTQRAMEDALGQLDSFGSKTIPATQPQVGQPAPQLLGAQTSSTLVPSTNPQDTLDLVNHQETRISSDHDPSGSDPSGSDPSGSDPSGSDPSGSDPSGSEDEEEPGSSTKPKPKATPKPKTKTKKRRRVVERSESPEASMAFSVDGMKKDMVSVVEATYKRIPKLRDLTTKSVREKCPPS